MQVNFSPCVISEVLSSKKLLQPKVEKAFSILKLKTKQSTPCSIITMLTQYKDRIEPSKLMWSSSKPLSFFFVICNDIVILHLSGQEKARRRLTLQCIDNDLWIKIICPCSMNNSTVVSHWVKAYNKKYFPY